jgi:hypothetical protein
MLEAYKTFTSEVRSGSGFQDLRNQMFADGVRWGNTTISHREYFFPMLITKTNAKRTAYKRNPRSKGEFIVYTPRKWEAVVWRVKREDVKNFHQFKRGFFLQLKDGTIYTKGINQREFQSCLPVTDPLKQTLTDMQEWALFMRLRDSRKFT